MKDMRKYLVATLAAIIFVTTASTSSLAIIGNSNNFSVPRKNVVVQHNKQKMAAHRIVSPSAKKKNDFATLNR